MLQQEIWQRLIALIGEQIGFQVRRQDLKYFQPKVTARMESLGIDSLSGYYDFLSAARSDSSPQRYLAQKEWQALANAITNGESFFFRDRGQFELLKETILPQIIEGKRSQRVSGKTQFLTLKIWSAGCSTGEEAYSLAMLVGELISDVAQWHIAIIGTDLNQEFLQKATKGVYKEWSFRQTDPLFKEKYFIKQRDGWLVKPHLQSMVTFYQDNLLETKKISHYTYDIDLVLCRNVFIYFNREAISKAVEKISKTLVNGGYFLPGHAELQNIPLKNFSALNFNRSSIFQYRHSLLSKEETTNKECLLTAPKPDLQPKDSLTTNAMAKTIPLRIKAIKQLLAKEKYETVIKQAAELIQNNRELLECYDLIALSYFQQDDLVTAQQYCQQALQQDCFAISPILLLGKIAFAQQQHRKAKELYKRVIYLEPENIEAHLELGKIYKQEGDAKRAEKMYLTVKNIVANKGKINLVQRQALAQIKP